MHRFLSNFNQHKGVSEETIREILENSPISFIVHINASLSREIMEKEFSSGVHSMTKGKVPGHNTMPMEFLKKYWTIIGGDV